MAFTAPLALPAHRRFIATTQRRTHARARRPRRAPLARAPSEADTTASTPLTPPPSTFYQAVTQAQDAVQDAVSDGHTLLEVEFPPLPTSRLSSSAVGADEVSDANLRLALDFCARFAESGKNVVVALPDAVEKDRAVGQAGETPAPNVRFGALRDGRGSLLERLWTTPAVDVAVRQEDDMFVVLGASCQELPDVEDFVKAATGRPVVLFNLKLDSARGDLGLPAFPRRELHYRFLSGVLPAYYIRTRSYSRSIPRRPYVVNFSGALYRAYPGGYQVLLDTEGSYRRLAVREERPALGEVRDLLTEGMELDGVLAKGGSVFQGYKSRTWWEEDRTRAVSNEWRS